METRCTSGNRDMILHVLQSELQQNAMYHPGPEFRCTVGGYSILRDGRITVDEDSSGLFGKLAELGLCDAPFIPEEAPAEWFSYSMEGHNAKSILNLFSIISSRQQFLNRALAAKNSAFYVSRELMEHLLSHPPVTVEQFLQALYSWESDYRGIAVNRTFLVLSGFLQCPREEELIHRQLAKRIIYVSLHSQWIKPFTRNVKNKKYAFRTWLNEIGMIGPEYEEARTVMLSRLYGKSDRRSMIR